MRAFVTVLVAVFMLIAVSLVGFFAQLIKIPYSVVFWGRLVLWVLFMLVFIYYSIRKVITDPPHKAVLVFLGRRQKKVLSEGWHFFPLYPIIFDFIEIDVTKVNKDLVGLRVKTPDLADLEFDVSITFTPGSWTENKENQAELLKIWDDKQVWSLETWNEYQAELLIIFLNSGREEGVITIITDIIQDRLRIWAFSKEEGSATWQEAIGAKDEALAILIKAILGDEIPRIPSSIPTGVLLRYFSDPRKRPLEYQKRWGKQSEAGSEWEGLEKELQKITEADRIKIKKSVEQRQEIITKVKQGNGFFVKRSLGITINRFTINKVVLIGKAAEAVEKRVVEDEERKAEETELEHLRARIKELNRESKLSKEQAVEIVQTERGKISKAVNETKISLSPEVIDLGKKLLKLLGK